MLEYKKSYFVLFFLNSRRQIFFRLNFKLLIRIKIPIRRFGMGVQTEQA